MQKYTDILKCLNYTSIYLNISYILVTFIFIYSVIKDKRIGVVISIISLFVICFIPYTIGYLPVTMIKIMLLILGALILFTSLVFTCTQHTINKFQILTTFVFLNSFCLIFTTNNIFMILSLLFLSITTPIFTVKGTSVIIESSLISKDIWVIFSTIILSFYYILNPYFCHNTSMVITALLIPCFMHFYNNMFLEARALSLCIFFIFDILNNSKKSISDLITDSKF